jgi:hypothetical protein
MPDRGPPSEPQPSHQLLEERRLIVNRPQKLVPLHTNLKPTSPVEWLHRMAEFNLLE